MDTTQTKVHVANCPKCKNATKIGRLCSIGRRCLDKELLSLFLENRNTNKALINRTITRNI